MKWIVSALVLLLLALQFQIWLADDGYPLRRRLDAQIQQIESENRELRARNEALSAEVRDLKQGLDAVEERARQELGMVGRDEVFYHVVDQRPEREQAAQNDE